MQVKKSKTIQKRTQHVISLGKGWVVRDSSSGRFNIITDNKAAAITVARNIAKNSRTEIVIHGKDGKILSMESFDPKSHRSPKKASGSIGPKKSSKKNAVVKTVAKKASTSKRASRAAKSKDIAPVKKARKTSRVK